MMRVDSFAKKSIFKPLLWATVAENSLSICAGFLCLVEKTSMTSANCSSVLGRMIGAWGGGTQRKKQPVLPGLGVGERGSGVFVQNMMLEQNLPR